MEYIFQHEVLRKDEIHQKINAKNSFQPQRPLRNNKKTFRKSADYLPSFHNSRSNLSSKNQSPIALKATGISMIPSFLSEIMHPSSKPSTKEVKSSQVPSKKKSSKNSPINLITHIPTVIRTN